MAVSNRERVGRGFELLALALEPFIDRLMRRADGDEWAERFANKGSGSLGLSWAPNDPSFQLMVMTARWDDVFKSQLARSMRSLVFELRDTRNRWAHNQAFQARDAFSALDSVRLMLEAIDAREADPVRELQDEIGRELYERQRDREETASSNVVDSPGQGLLPWRQLIVPHADVREGRLKVAEFAANLQRVVEGSESTAREYRDPELFFARTYVTRGLRGLLSGAVQRISGAGGQPVINCQTNFGGGKTHSLIALYHLFSGVDIDRLPSEVAEVVRSEGLSELPDVRRAVIVGGEFKAGQAMTKPDGTVVNTIWGEIAYQLGGRDGFDLLAESDRNRTSPGDLLVTLFRRCSPCIVLIDEWVRYAGELYGRDDLPGGSFDSQFTFAQAITSAAQAVDGALLVVSIPASEPTDRPDAESTVSALEVGGMGGREALQRLSHVVARVAEHWQPAQGDESFEIVRRRLFEPISDEAMAGRDATADAFGAMYRKQRAEFPGECAEIRYAERIKAAYPIHPEVFDRLYQDWSTVDRFQRTRGVLRLMASVVRALWESDDQSPLVLPCSIPLDDPTVNAELTSKLDDHWRPVIDADIDGPQSRSAQIDRELPALGRNHATRRAARTVFFGSASTLRSPNRGLPIDRVRLGCCFPGDSPALVQDALSRLADQAPYLYVDRSRYWFDLQENVNRTARDEADRMLASDLESVHAEVIRRLRQERGTGEFRRVHVAPATSDSVADDATCRLVVLGPDTPYIAKADESPALDACWELLTRRGAVPRDYKNMLVFAAPDQRSLENLERTTADYLAWSGIWESKAERDLNETQRRLVENRVKQGSEAVDLRITESYQWAIVPTQPEPLGEILLEPLKLDSQGTIAQRTARKLVNEGRLSVQFAPPLLRARLDGELMSLWDGGHLAVKELWETFAKYVYLPRLRDIEVLIGAVEAGPARTTWQSDGYAVAAGVDSTSGRYIGLTLGSHPGPLTGAALIVRPEFALGQLEVEARDSIADGSGLGLGTDGFSDLGDVALPSANLRNTVFSGRAAIDPARPNRAFPQIVQEILDHLAASADSVEITVSIRAHKHDGFADEIVRTVTENARTLKFEPGSGFSES